MSSSGDKRRKGISSFGKRAKNIFTRGKTAPSASTSTGPKIAPVALASQQREASILEVRRDGSEAVPVSAPSGNAPPISPSTEERVLDRTAPDTVPVAELRDANVESPTEALPPPASEVATAPLTQAPDMQPVLSDTDRTLERYKNAIERITKALELRRDEWEPFELSGFDSLPLVGEADFKTLQLKIDKVLDSRNKASQNRTKWQKSKDVVEQCFTALAPIMKIVLSVAHQAAQVTSLLESQK
jgi:hypothetical protein